MFVKFFENKNIFYKSEYFTDHLRIAIGNFQTQVLSVSFMVLR